MEPILKNINNSIRLCKRLNETVPDFELVVLSIHRYLIDQTFQSDTGIKLESANYADPDVYDVVLTDGWTQSKFLLLPKWNCLVQSFSLRPGSVVRIQPAKCSIRVNEMKINEAPFVIIEDLNIVGRTDRQLDPDEIPYCDSSGELSDRSRSCPLVTSRGSYTSLWNNETPCGGEQQIEIRDAVNLDSTITVSKLVRSWKRLAQPYPDLLVRVINLSRIRCYAKPYSQNKWPYQVHLDVADGSGLVTVVLWSSLVCDLHRQVRIGSTLLLENYRIRDRFALMSLPSDRSYQLTRFNFEIVLNPHQTKIRLVSPSTLQIAQLPSVRFLLFPSCHLGTLPNNINIDAAGVVTYVGRYHRSRIVEGGSQFWLRRWIHVSDWTCDQPIRLELYETSQPDEHRLILPGAILIATQLRLVNNNAKLSHSRQQRSVYLTTTTESQIIVLRNGDDDQKLLIRENEHVRKIEEWSASTDGEEFVRSNSSIGGYYKYPLLSTNLEDYKDGFNSEKPFTLTTSEELPVLLKSLAFRESRRLHVLAKIAELSYYEVFQDLGISSQSSCSPLFGSEAGFEGSSFDSAIQPGSLTSSEMHFNNPVTTILIDSLWPRFRDTVPTFGTPAPLPSIFTRCFRTEDDDAVISSCLDMPTGGSIPSYSHKLIDLPITDGWMGGVLAITLLGVNENIALNTLLPVHFNDDASVNEPVSVQEQSDYLSLLQSRPIVRQVNQSRTATIHGLMKEFEQAENKQFCFVLDVYRSDDGDERMMEIVINQTFHGQRVV